MNKKQKEILAMVYWDLGCIIPPKHKDNKYHLELAIMNLKDLMDSLKIKEHGEDYDD